MKPVWVVAAIFGVVMLVCCGVGTYFIKGGVESGGKARAQAESYATRTLTAIAKDWDLSVLDSFTNAVYRRANTPAESREMLRAAEQKLGAIKDVGDWSMRGIEFSSETGRGAVTTVKLSTDATFEKRRGEVDVTVVRERGQWHLQEFRVD